MTESIVQHVRHAQPGVFSGVAGAMMWLTCQDEHCSLHTLDDMLM